MNKRFLSTLVVSCTCLLSDACVTVAEPDSEASSKSDVGDAEGVQTAGEKKETTETNSSPSNAEKGEETSGKDGEATEPSSETPDDAAASSKDGASSTSAQEEPTETGECEDGDKAECDELEDGSKVAFPTGVPMGPCKRGTKTCVGEKWGKCVGTIAPIAKDKCDVPGDDSNCDGVPNSGCDCISGKTRPCGKSDVGECRMGKQSCVGGQWSEDCVGAVMPSKERCDGNRKDEDCDGAADTDDADCECIDNSQEFCERAGQRGDCKWGKRTCRSGRWSRCAEWAVPEQEVCGRRNPVSGVAWTGDENCDGGVDTSPFGRVGPRGCVRMMMDKDRDGFGRIGKDLSEMQEGENLEKLATACICTTRADIQDKYREGWVRAQRDRENRDCGDCQVGGDIVVPGSSRKYDEPSVCLKSLRHPLPFDYNCNGSEDRLYRGKFTCELDSSTNSCVKRGAWADEAGPKCGESADYLGDDLCNMEGGECTQEGNMQPPQKTQFCG